MDASFRRAVQKARGHEDLFFAGLLSEDRILRAFGTARSLWQGWIYTPAVTIWVFLAQCLSEDHSCRDAVAQLIAWRLSRGLRCCSADTGAYCTQTQTVYIFLAATLTVNNSLPRAIGHLCVDDVMASRRVSEER